MAVTVGQFRPPPVKVSITDGVRQLEFDRPADMADYLSRHPEIAQDISQWEWTLQRITGGH